MVVVVVVVALSSPVLPAAHPQAAAAVNRDVVVVVVRAQGTMLMHLQARDMMKVSCVSQGGSAAETFTTLTNRDGIPICIEQE